MKATNNKRYRAVTAVLSIAAVGLLAFGSVGGARAALTYSDTYRSQIQTQRIGVGLTENEESLSGTTLMGDFTDGEKFKIGQKYDYAIGAENTGTIDEYVRLTIRKFWIDDSEDKQVDLSTDLINLEFNEDDWYIGEETDEMVVLYYKHPLPAGTMTSDYDADALTSFMVDNSIETKVSFEKSEKAESDGSITTVYTYGDLSVGIDADVDAVQTHHAQDAMLSAWGVDVTFEDDGTTIQTVE